MIAIIFWVLFVLGLTAGSYLNSWIWRFHSGKWQFPARSICVYCSQELEWHDNIPVFSYLFLKGKCRFCDEPIPREYIWVELFGGLVLAIVGLHAYAYALAPVEIFRNIFFGILLLVIFVYDAKYMEIPSGVVWAGTLVAFVINYRLGLSAYSLALGVAVGGGFFLAQYLVSKGRWIGGGDVRLGVMMGALLGWPQVVVAIGLSYILGALYAIPLLIFKKKTGDSQIAFGTFLTIGTMIFLLFGESILKIFAL